MAGCSVDWCNEQGMHTWCCSHFLAMQTANEQSEQPTRTGAAVSQGEHILGNDTSAQLLWSFLHSDYSSQQQKQRKSKWQCHRDIHCLVGHISCMFGIFGVIVWNTKCTVNFLCEFNETSVGLILYVFQILFCPESLRTSHTSSLLYQQTCYCPSGHSTPLPSSFYQQSYVLSFWASFMSSLTLSARVLLFLEWFGYVSVRLMHSWGYTISVVYREYAWASEFSPCRAYTVLYTWFHPKFRSINSGKVPWPDFIYIIECSKFCCTCMASRALLVPSVLVSSS